MEEERCAEQQARCNIFLHYFFKQPSEHLSERRFPPPKMTYGGKCAFDEKMRQIFVNITGKIFEADVALNGF